MLRGLPARKGRTEDRLTVSWAGQSVELGFQGEAGDLIAGPWGFQIAMNAEPLTGVSSWDEVCWHEDEDVAYLELTMRLSQGCRIERQVVLARQDRFVLLADAVLGRRRAKWDYRGGLSLPKGVKFRAARQSYEGFLINGRRRALVLPLALPEWRDEAAGGELAAADGALVLHQSAEGRGFFAPLFLDFHPRRMTGPRTWRQLTVAENLARVKPDVAVGYRVKVGSAQWLAYRALARRGNRTVLGHNLTTETLVARFGRKGEVQTIVEIE